jgi:hypothetical protein
MPQANFLTPAAPCRIHAIKGVEQFANLFGGTLGHNDDLSKPATPNQFGRRRITSNPKVDPQKQDGRNQASQTRCMDEMGAGLSSIAR